MHEVLFQKSYEVLVVLIEIIWNSVSKKMSVHNLDLTPILTPN